jgi:hypothetical protein
MCCTTACFCLAMGGGTWHSLIALSCLPVLGRVPGGHGRGAVGAHAPATASRPVRPATKPTKHLFVCIFLTNKFIAGMEHVDVTPSTPLRSFFCFSCVMCVVGHVGRPRPSLRTANVKSTSTHFFVCRSSDDLHSKGLTIDILLATVSH